MNDPYQPFVACPYDSNHLMPRFRLQAHIVRCQEKHPELKICPYNATHRLKYEAMKAHVSECPDREEIFPKQEPPKQMGAVTVPKPLFNKDYLPETDPNHEIWDN